MKNIRLNLDTKHGEEICEQTLCSGFIEHQSEDITRSFAPKMFPP